MANELLGKARSINGITVVEQTGLRMPDVVKNLAFKIREKSPEHTVFVGATYDPTNKPLLTVMVSEDLVKEGMNASVTVREAAKLIQGGGGGQPGFAQAGGKNKDSIAKRIRQNETNTRYLRYL